MNRPKINIEMWSDFRCPFCYIADAMMKKLEKEVGEAADIELIHRAYELYPNAPKETDSTILDSYSQKYGISKKEAEEKIALISDSGRRAGINNFNYGGAVPTNSFDAHRLAKCAEAKGIKGMYDRLMYAYFCDNVNIADRDVLLDIAEEEGISREEAEKVLNYDYYSQQVRDDERDAAMRDIKSVPCFLVDGTEKFLGTGCFEEMKDYIKKQTQQDERQ